MTVQRREKNYVKQQLGNTVSNYEKRSRDY